MLVVGCIHGNECEGMVVVNALLRTHPHEDLWLLPNLNPDGYDGNDDEEPEETVQPAEAVIDEPMGTEVHLVQRYRSSLSVR